jgi:chromosome segregation ATPase
MVDNEKRENLANARRKLKKFRDQQPSISPANGDDGHPINKINESTNNYNITPGFVNEQRSTPNGTHPNSPRSPIIDLKEQTRLENQRRLNSASSMSGRTSTSSVDIEQKLRRDIDHLQEQLEIHVQTIGILVAEKTDVSAKLTQSLKQLERKQGEMDELYGRLKASRERVQELEKEIQNSTSNVQKREMAAKESDKENDRLKIENIRQSQFIEDLKQNINQLNLELEKLKKSTNETSITDEHKNTQIEELVSSINRIRSDNEQYQEYNLNMQHHIQELNDQVNRILSCSSPGILFDKDQSIKSNE